MKRYLALAWAVAALTIAVMLTIFFAVAHMWAAFVGASLVWFEALAGADTWLGTLNFWLLQWFGVRLAASFNPEDIPGWSKLTITDAEVRALGGRWWSRYAPPRGVPVRWVWMRWIWPLTGWRSQYRWITAVSPYRIEK